MLLKISAIVQRGLDFANAVIVRSQVNMNHAATAHRAVPQNQIVVMKTNQLKFPEFRGCILMVVYVRFGHTHNSR